MKKSILFISYYHHPHTLTATRNYYLSSLLAELGYEVHVLRKSNSENVQYIQHPNIQYHIVNAWDYRTVLSTLGIHDGITSQLIKPGRLINWGYKLLLNFPYNLFIGEGGGFYYLAALKRGVQIIKKHNISIIYSSYRPITDHFIASKLKAQNPSLKWIGDFRDVLWWTKEDSNYKKKWITSLIGNMDSITAVTSGIANFWSSVYNKPVYTVYNGLPKITLNKIVPLHWKNKFTINYSGRIYTDFQYADCFFQSICELIEENPSFGQDINLHYSGINNEHWSHWISKFNLMSISEIKNQQPVQIAWNNMAHAQINLLLTWSNKNIKGFIHGKFNEYVAIRNPILCLVEGDRDLELENIYSLLSNSLIVTNKNENKGYIKTYILSMYQEWKNKGEVPLISQAVIESYAWEHKAKPLLDLIGV